jgi:hypothetical protein
VVTPRAALAGACLALAMLTTAACSQFNDAINKRDLQCDEVPEDICTTLADDLSEWFPHRVAEHGPIVKVSLRPLECGAVIARRDQVVARCWEGNGNAAVRADGSEGAGFHKIYYQVTNGRIFDGNGRLVGSGPVE